MTQLYGILKEKKCRATEYDCMLSYSPLRVNFDKYLCVTPTKNLLRKVYLDRICSSALDRFYFLYDISNPFVIPLLLASHQEYGFVACNVQLKFITTNNIEGTGQRLHTGTRDVQRKERSVSIVSKALFAPL